MIAEGDRGLRRPSTLFGNRTRTQILLMLALVGESYPRELARMVDAPLSSVQKAIDRLETEGVLATRRIGVERRVSLDPTFILASELRQLLFRLAQSESSLAGPRKLLR